jgi:hypothetical protein
MGADLERFHVIFSNVETTPVRVVIPAGTGVLATKK